jgi:hypothetical protein
LTPTALTQPLRKEWTQEKQRKLAVNENACYHWGFSLAPSILSLPLTSFTTNHTDLRTMYSECTFLRTVLHTPTHNDMVLYIDTSIL